MPIDRPSPGTIADFFDVGASNLIFSFAGSAKLTGSRSRVDGTYSASFLAASSFFAFRALRFLSFPIVILEVWKEGVKPSYVNDDFFCTKCAPVLVESRFPFHPDLCHSLHDLHCGL